MPPLLRAAAPMGLALAAAALVLVTALQLLPARVVVVHLRDGATGLAASRSDLLLVASSVLVGLVLAYLVTAAALAWTPARHLLVPHPEHWKAPANRPELRLRLARWAARAFAAAVWFVVALVVLALAGQGDGPLAAWWLPLLVSSAYLLVVLGGAAWAFGVGFAVPTAPPRAAPVVRPTPGAGAASGLAATPARPAPAPRAAPAATAGKPAPAPGAARTPRPGSATAPRTPSPAPGRRPATGRGAGGDPDGKGPPRPYQPRPTRGGPSRG